MLSRDFTRDSDPIRVAIDATLVDTAGVKLAGAAPLQIRLLDPLGNVRYDLYRATDMGTACLSLPLAANDPAGQWTVEVKELLDNHVGSTKFIYRPAGQCGALGGAVPRAVFFGDERENVFRFFRTHQDVTIVKGKSEWCIGAAERLATILKPWGIRSTVIDAADVNRPRTLTPEEARTWVGLEFGRAVAGDGNRPAKVGFALSAPAVLIGSPKDNPLIEFVRSMGFLPYAPSAEFPGRGRGYLSWQRDAVGPRQESLTLVAEDAEGMAEAVGSLYEAAAGIEPLTRWTLPAASAVTPATIRVQPPEGAVVWQAVLPDRVLSLAVNAAGGITALSLDGSATVIDKTGQVVSRKRASAAEIESAKKAALVKPAVPSALASKLVPNRLPRFAATGPAVGAIAYWGGTLQIFSADGALKAQQLQPQDISASPDGKHHRPRRPVGRSRAGLAGEMSVYRLEGRRAGEPALQFFCHCPPQGEAGIMPPSALGERWSRASDRGECCGQEIAAQQAARRRLRGDTSCCPGKMPIMGMMGGLIQ